MSKHIGYHFLRADMTTRNGREPAWTVGETRRLKGPLEICFRGYHASPTPWDALQYAPGPVLCLVELTGVTKATTHDDKWAGRTRKLVKAVNVERDLHELACQFAESVLPIAEKDTDDRRPRQAIEAKRAWLRGEITDEELEAAREAARAGGYGEWGAVRAAAWAASCAAEQGAVRAAAWAAVWDPLMDEQKALTNRVLLSALEGGAA